MVSFLKLEGLGKSFGGLQAVSNVGFEVERGEILGLIGPNGSGKTTILNLITGFLKPDSGAIYPRAVHARHIRHRLHNLAGR